MLNYNASIKQNEILSMKSPEDIAKYDPNITRRIVFSSQYTGPVDVQSITQMLRPIKRIEEISFFKEISWELACKLNVLHPRQLYFTVSLDEPPQRLEFDELQALTIYMHNADCAETLFNMQLLHSVQYDFSGVPNLTQLELRHWEHLDYFCLAQLPKLKTLLIADNTLYDLFWLSRNYKLEKFTCFGKLEDITAITVQNKLQRLCLSYNNIVDGTPLLCLENLQHLDIYKNPINCENQLRAMGIETLIITAEDKELQHV